MTSDPVKLQRILRYTFRNQELLKEALMHRSFATENNIAYDNQRLEFLGDAVLQIILTEYLFFRYPDFHEGDLTKLRSALANQDTLALLARDIDLGSALSLGRGEIECGGSLRDSTLSDAMEALMAAIMLDSSQENVRNIFLGLLLNRYPNPADLLADLNPKGNLQEYTQQRLGCQPEYRVLSVSGPDHNPSFEIEVLIHGKAVATGRANKRKIAESKAARAALERIQQGTFPFSVPPENAKEETNAI